MCNNYTLLNAILLWSANITGIMDIIRLMKQLILTSIVAINFTVAKASELDPINFSESLKKEIPVSGNLLVGIYSGKEWDVMGLSAYIPAGKQTICLTVKSIDGTYISSSKYLSDNEKNQMVILKYPTKYIEKISNFKANEVALLASVRSNFKDCIQRGKHILLNLNGLASPEIKFVNIYINTARVVSKIRHSSSQKSPIDCQKIIHDRAITYDAICRIPVKEFISGKWVIYREIMGRNLPPSFFYLSNSFLKNDQN